MYLHRGGETAGSNAPGAFLVLSLQTRKKYDKSPTFKIYTTSACILRGRNIFWTPRAVRTTAGLMPLGLFTPPSGRGLVIPVFYPAVRTGSSNTHFFSCFFFGGHLHQTSGFRSAKQILVVSFATQARAFILSDRNIFYTPGGWRTTEGSNVPGAFLVFFFWWSLAPDLCTVKTILGGNFRSFRVYSPEFS